MRIAALALLGCLLAAPAPAADRGQELYRAGRYDEAVAWWREAAQRGVADAAFRLGVVYADGLVVPRDHAQAARWLRVGAEAGDPRAQFDLGTLFDEGWGVVQSHAEAARWYRAAAERGHPAGQFNLGSMYEHGHGVARDPVQAYKWYTLAARGGFPMDRLGSLERLDAELEPAQVRRAVEAALAFRPQR